MSSASPEKSQTPMMRQWQRMKEQHPDALLLFRMGDFYEMFGADAETASRELELTLTARSKDENAVPMCGMPYHAAERYIAQLVGKGYRCAICDQVEDPKYARGLVKREVTRVLSPGTVLEEAFLQSVGASRGNNYLAALVPDAHLNRFGLALIDISTGEFSAGEIEAESAAATIETPSQNVFEYSGNARPRRAAKTPDGALFSSEENDAEYSEEAPAEEIPSEIADPDQTPLAADADRFRWNKVREELLRYAPSELLLPQELRENSAFMAMLQPLQMHVTPFDSSGMDTPRARLLHHFNTMSLRGYGVEELPLAQAGASLILEYLQQTQLGALGHVRHLRVLSGDEWMLLDSATRRNLELVQSLRDGSARGTLFGLLDETRTGAGARLLKKWILQPLLSTERIENRQNAVAEMLGDVLLRGDVRQLLRGLGDIERLVSRTVTGQGNARDLVALRNALQTLPQLRQTLLSTQASALQTVQKHLDPAPHITQLLANALADEPPAILTDGGLIREGFDEMLDETRRAAREGKSWVAQLEESERARTGIKNLKVGFNNVFGYYIEVTKTNLAAVPDDYIRKQTTANAERYITPDLKEKESQILGAQDRANEREKFLFEGVRAQVAGEAAALLDTARALAHLDVYAALAEVAARRDYVRPQMRDDNALDIRGGRHPVVESSTHEPFVPNDCALDDTQQQVVIITGPNASGKSTFLRQVALIVLMAQIGSFVPARSAHIGLTDRIFTRVGAQDDLATGQSTFTVEMNETANILNNATPRSLVILDEVGRGTSTYDGLSIAWAVAEFLHERGPKTLFATHYHHLNELEERLPRARNYRIAVKEDGDHILFLRRIIRGGTDKSFGIQVARLAGLPAPVIARARELLSIFSREKLRGIEAETPPLSTQTVSLFEETAPAEAMPVETAPHPLLREIAALDVDNLTPMEALVKLSELKKAASL